MAEKILAATTAAVTLTITLLGFFLRDQDKVQAENDTHEDQIQASPSPTRTQPTSSPPPRHVTGSRLQIPESNFVDFDGAQLLVEPTQTSGTDVNVGPDQWYPTNGARIGLLDGARDCRTQPLGTNALSFRDAGFDPYDTRAATVCVRSRVDKIAQVTVTFKGGGRYSPYQTIWQLK